MLFSYLNLPALPLELEQLCLDNIALIDNDARLNELNKKEGIGHSITYIPQAVQNWIFKNILVPNFNPIPPEMMTKTMLHVSHYIKHQEGTGVHPTHIDYGRKYAINYIINTGGDNVKTYWTDNSKNNIIEELVIEPKRWHIIKVNPAWHGVTGIRIGKLRTIVSICYSPDDSVDVRDFFNKIIL